METISAKERSIKNQLIFLFVALFIFNFALRSFLFSSSSFLIGFNIFVLIAVVMILININKYKINSLPILIAVAVLAFIINSYHSAGFHLGHFVISIATLLFPLMLLSIKIEEKMSLTLVKYCTKIFNVMIFILLIYGIMDYLSKGRLQSYIYNNSGLEEFSGLISRELSTNIYRMYSFWGHPLDNACYFILFIVMNLIYRRYFDRALSPLVISIVSLLGLLLSGSKMGIIIGIVLLFYFFQSTKYRTLYIFLGSIALLALFMSPIFQNNLLLRFLDAYNSKDFSNGRITAYNALANSTYNVQLFEGGGYGSSRAVTDALKVVNFEFPLLMYLFDYGIVATALIYLAILVIPVKTLMKKKNYFLIPSFLGFFAYINSNNGLASNGELFGQLCFVIIILQNLPPKKTIKEETDSKLIVQIQN